MTWWRSLHQGTTILETLQPKIHDQMAFALVFSMFVGLLVCAWLLVHRLRVAWLEEQADDRRASTRPSPSAGPRARRRSTHADRGMSRMSNWIYVWLGWGIAAVALVAYAVMGARPRAGPLSRRVAPRGPSMDVIEPARAPASTSAPAPRRPPPSAPRAAARWLPTVVIVLVLVGAGFVVSKALTSAALFFYNADEAVAKKAELGTSRFRIAGHRRERRPAAPADGADFTITYNGVEVPVDHVGDPPELFKPGEPGRARGPLGPSDQRLFDSDLMLVKHDANYTAKNSDRLKQADDGRQGGAELDHLRPRERSAGSSSAVNLALGTAGVVLGLVASICAVVTIAVGLVRAPAGAGAPRPHLHRGWCSSRRVAVGVRHGAGADHPRLHRAVRRRQRQRQARRSCSTSPAMWSALEGSILLWALVPRRATRSRSARSSGARLDDPLVGWALLTMFVVCVFFFGLLMGPANPFRVVRPGARLDGPGPNPLLQNHILMAFHPPMLYLGYVGFTVPFAFAIAALVTGRVGEGWLVETRRWTLFAWGFLTVGIVLGAWWSYEVLGWGGYWAWDPVENASFLPWLTGTAYLHSVMVQERRGMLRVWNLSLLCATFALTILGTFLTRSGVLESRARVHRVGASGRPSSAFFGLVVAVTIGLIAWRGDRLRSPGRIDSPLSREGAFLANNLLFAAFAFVVLLGTVFPLIVEAINGSQHLGRRALLRPHDHADRHRAAVPHGRRAGAAVAQGERRAAAPPPALAGVDRRPARWCSACCSAQRGFAPLVAFGLGGFAAGSAGRQLVLATRRQGWRGLVGRANGGMIVHIGVVMIAVAFAASASNVRQAEFTLHAGAVRPLRRPHDHLPAPVHQGRRQQDPDQRHRAGRRQRTVRTRHRRVPPVRRHDQPGRAPRRCTRRPAATWPSACWRCPTANSTTVTLRVTSQPLVMWLWIGGGVIALGTALAAFPGRRRRPTQPVSAPVPERRRRPRRRRP